MGWMVSIETKAEIVNAHYTNKLSAKKISENTGLSTLAIKSILKDNKSKVKELIDIYNNIHQKEAKEQSDREKFDWVSIKLSEDDELDDEDYDDSSKKRSKSKRRAKTPPHLTIEQLRKKKIVVKRRSDEELKAQVISLFEDGCDINQIITKTRCLCKSEIEAILYKEGKISKPPDTDNPLQMKYLPALDEEGLFQKSIKEGDSLRVDNNPYRETYNFFSKKCADKVITITIIKKYAHTCLTDLGYFRYSDLYIGYKRAATKK